MKKILTPSHSSSPSSSSTFNFDPTLCNNSKGAGCFTNIFHRIRELSSIVSTEKDQELKQKTTISTVSVSEPGIVARLMGLESNSEIPSKETHSNSLSHSQSMNSSPVPEPFCFIESDNFLVLSFESECESRGFKSKGRRRRKKRERVGNDGGEVQGIGNTLNMISSEKDRIDDSEAVKLLQSMMKLDEGVSANGEKVNKRTSPCCTEKKVQIECSTPEDSSPVSVFDFERQEALETEAVSFGVGLNWRRKLSPELEIEQETEKNYKHESSNKKEKQSHEDCADVWGEICRLVEEDLVGLMRKQCGDFDSISADFESEIFDHLLNELIDQLLSL